MTTSAELPIGTAIQSSYERLRTVADACGRLRTVATTNATSSEHTLNPQTPRVKREPLLHIREKYNCCSIKTVCLCSVYGLWALVMSGPLVPTTCKPIHLHISGICQFAPPAITVHPNPFSLSQPAVSPRTPFAVRPWSIEFGKLAAWGICKHWIQNSIDYILGCASLRSLSKRSKVHV